MSDYGNIVFVGLLNSSWDIISLFFSNLKICNTFLKNWIIYAGNRFYFPTQQYNAAERRRDSCTQLKNFCTILNQNEIFKKHWNNPRFVDYKIFEIISVF